MKTRGDKGEISLFRLQPNVATTCGSVAENVAVERGSVEVHREKIGSMFVQNCVNNPNE